MLSRKNLNSSELMSKIGSYKKDGNQFPHGLSSIAMKQVIFSPVNGRKRTELTFARKNLILEIKGISLRSRISYLMRLSEDLLNLNMAC